MEDSAQPFYRWKELQKRYGSSLLGRMIRARWLTPCVRSHRFSLFTAKSVASADERLASGQLPPRHMKEVSP
ncbi:hypothetical protein Oter_4121 [Opitutus terrae PB90-1]|uniref:Uncharacterized protein n=1 Tax=Opitutus terrae (strain DSM 11246 / JCM 15787 / PB90-1) TaxID=452637 RepID=B2A059_OPITP|nr:hypothetical protein Oter_4121 [Opitutus terrae PB90-1]